MSELLHRAVDILDQLRLAGGELGIRDIASRVGLPKSTVQRVLRDLLDTDMATQDPVTRRYRLGPRTLALGTAYQHSVNLRNVSMPLMMSLRDRCGETVGLSVAVGNELMHVDQAESRSQLRRVFEIGHPLPMWCGAPSRIFLADLTEEEAERLVNDRDATDVVPHNPPSPERMLAEVEQARTDGFSIAVEETLSGVSTLAVPVHGPLGRVVATISVTGPSTRLTPAAMDRVLDDLTEVATTVSSLIGAPAPRRLDRQRRATGRQS